MAAGKPVIASAVGGIPEMIAHGQTGLLFANEDARELAGHLQMLARNPALRQQIGIRAQQFVRESRGIENYVRSFAAFL
jgi:glycosyltransferase involved in cell wall biosynthesis